MPIGANHTNTSTSSIVLPPPRHHSRVHHWTIFIDNYEILATSISKQFTLLSCLKDYTSQRRLLKEVEQDIFECKQSIEEIEREIEDLPYNLRSKASQTVDNCKNELEGYYSLLLAYQEAHNRGETYFPSSDASNHQNTIQMSDQDDIDNRITISLEQDQDDSPSNEDDEDNDQTRLLDSNRRHEHVREQLLNSSQMMSNMRNSAASNSLNRSSQSLIESIEMGELSNNQLVNQRESIMKQRSQLLSSQESANQSIRTIDRVRWRAFTDHIVSWLVVLVQIVLFIIVAYLKYFAID